MWVYFLRTESKVFSQFKGFKYLLENQIGKKIKVLNTDNGGEFCSLDFVNFFNKNGIKMHMTILYTLQWNGVAKWMKTTLMERGRSMFSGDGLEKKFWEEAVVVACYLINKSPTLALMDKIPLWRCGKERKPHFNMFIVVVVVRHILMYLRRSNQSWIIRL
jgi:hypothetical protein